MMRILVLLCAFSVLIYSCKKESSETIKLEFIDEYILPDSLLVDGTLVGGLSGIDYDGNTFFVVSDDSDDPRYYEAQISIESDTISGVNINKVVKIKDTMYYYDLEAIRVENDVILMTSEGLIHEGKNPSFFRMSRSSHEIIDRFALPEYYNALSMQKPRTNGVFEGLTKSADETGYWVITELPLEADGAAPTYDKADTPVRMTYYEKGMLEPVKQHTYKLDKIARKPIGDFAVNGVTDLLAYDEDKFIVIERSFSSGHGSNSTSVKLYLSSILGATNTLLIDALDGKEYVAVSKHLLLDFDSVRHKLTNGIIDNVEGITFGPRLENGNRSLILIVDNDFNQQGNRLNQILLLELIEN